MARAESRLKCLAIVRQPSSTKHTGMHLKPFFLALILTVATSAYADPVQVTSGFAFASPPFTAGAGFDLHVDQLHFTGEAFGDDRGLAISGVRPQPEPLVNGAAVNLSSTITFIEGTAGATGHLKSTFVRWFGELTFVTPDTSLHDCVSREGEVFCNPEASFQVAGHLNAFDFASDAHLMDFNLTGHGQATGFFETCCIFPPGLNYVFETSAVPEPSSVLLVGSAIVGIAVRRWRTRMC